MRVGFDIDGVLANFTTPFAKALVDITGVDRLGGGPIYDEEKIFVQWDWPQYYGYRDEEVALVWKNVQASHTFWQKLPRYTEATELVSRITKNFSEHEFYFITDRRGYRVKLQTEIWLADRDIKGSVLITSQKGKACDVLNLDCYIDDRLKNVLDVCEQSPDTRAYLLNARWNQQESGIEELAYDRVYSLKDFLVKEGLYGASY